MLLVPWRTIRSSYIARDSVVIYFFPILDQEAHPASWAMAVPMVSLVLLCSEVLGGGGAGCHLPTDPSMGSHRLALEQFWHRRTVWTGGVLQKSQIGLC